MASTERFNNDNNDNDGSYYLKQQQQHVRSFWNPNDEKAACGVGFIVNIHGKPSQKVNILLNLDDLMNKFKPTKNDFISFCEEVCK